MLVGQGIISAAQLQEALELQKGRQARLGRLLVELGYVTEAQLAELIADKLRIPCVDIDTVTVEPAALRAVPHELAVHHRCLPWRIEGRALYLLMADATDLGAIDAVSFASGLRVRPVVIPDHQLARAIASAYQVESAEVLDHFDQVELADQLAVADETEADDVEDMSRVALSAPVVKLVNAILADAIRANASDIHIEPQQKGVDLRYRVDGVLRLIVNVPKRSQAKIVSRIKIVAHLDIAERRRPQDGRTRINLGGHVYDLRVSTLPTADGEKVVVRILPQDRANVTLDSLGFEADVLAQFQQVLGRPQGIVLVTGPTGSGKTSTLYAALNLLRGEAVNIVTIEDPVEYRLGGVNQVAVVEKAGLTFAEGLRSILRQDPDVLMVGEIRDRETAEIAFQAAQTGHLVLSTLHTNDAPSAVTRLVNLGIPGYLIASSLLGVLAQRLVRTLCDCKQGSPDRGFAPGGCAACRFTGFRGRTAVHELMRMTPPLRTLVLQDSLSADDLHRAAKANGMRPLYEDGLRKVARGRTTINELMHVVSPPDDDVRAVV